VIFWNSDEAEGKERRYLRVLEEQRVRGIVITPRRAVLDEADRPGEHQHRRLVFTPELVVRAGGSPLEAAAVAAQPR
jgi:DNA-binding LacI/PurR family transcriptional regulator